MKTNLKKQLASPGVEYKNGTIYWFCCEISFECFVYGDPIHICVINKPDDLVAEYLPIVLRR